jgi:hypothetical protein
MCKLIKQKVSTKSFWDKRDNLMNKPSLSYRSIEVIQYIMKKEEVAVGVAIEKLFTIPGLYGDIIKELSGDYPDINID